MTNSRLYFKCGLLFAPYREVAKYGVVPTCPRCWAAVQQDVVIAGVKA